MPAIIRIDPGAFNALQGAAEHVADIDKRATKWQMLHDLGMALQAAGGGFANLLLRNERKARADGLLRDETPTGEGTYGEESRRAGADAAAIDDEAGAAAASTGQRAREDAFLKDHAVNEYVETGNVNSVVDLINVRRKEESAAIDAQNKAYRQSVQDERADRAEKRADAHLDLAKDRERRAWATGIADRAGRFMKSASEGVAKLPRLQAAQQFIQKLVQTRTAEAAAAGKPFEGLSLTDLLGVEAIMAGRAMPEPILRTMPGVPAPASAQTAGTEMERTAASLLGSDAVDWNAVQAVFDTDENVDRDEAVMVGRISAWAAKQPPEALRRAVSALPEDPSHPSPVRGILEGRLRVMVDEKVRLALPTIEQAVAGAPTDEEAAKALQGILVQHGISEDDYADWMLTQRRRQSEAQGWQIAPPEDEKAWKRAKPGTIPMIDPTGKPVYLTIQQAEALGFTVGR